MHVAVCSCMIAMVYLSMSAQTPLAPNAPVDKPVDISGSDQFTKLKIAIEPSVKKARETWPEAKSRYLKGLPRGQVFFVSTELKDESHKFEIVFVEVSKISGNQISGVLASDIQLVKGLKSGDQYNLKESDVIDWTISKPDGSEEGNFVGKFLDTYNPK